MKRSLKVAKTGGREMSLGLDNGTIPPGLRISPVHLDSSVSLNMGSDITISGEDMAAMVHYWLTNTDIVGRDDPRLRVVASIKEMRLVPSYNDKRQRLSSNNPTCCNAPLYTCGLDPDLP